MSVTVKHGDCLVAMREMIAEGLRVDAVVCDPPYGLEFMGKEWDAPWKYGMSKHGFTDGAARVAAPSFSSSRNPMCLECHRHKRGKKRCECQTPRFDETEKRLADLYGFQSWCEEWARLAYELLPPGGHLVAFGGTRTYHRLAAAIEDAGFEIRDQLAWVYGQGFPKSLDVSKAIDKAAGAEREVVSEGATVRRIRPGADQNADGSWEKLTDRSYTFSVTAAATDAARQWDGWGTALKPAWEPIVLARKPLDGTVAGNVQEYGVGAINVDACRVAAPHGLTSGGKPTGANNPCFMSKDCDPRDARSEPHASGRWPANLVHDGSEEVAELFPNAGGGKGGVITYSQPNIRGDNFNRATARQVRSGMSYADTGSAARFFYCAKASKADRCGSKHPTVKPVALLRWLVRLVTPPGGTVLDPFAGTGTTGAACALEGFPCVLIEREAEYIADIKRRLALGAAA